MAQDGMFWGKKSLVFERHDLFGRVVFWRTVGQTLSMIVCSNQIPGQLLGLFCTKYLGWPCNLNFERGPR